MFGMTDFVQPCAPTADLDCRYEGAVDIITHAAIAFLYERDFPSSLQSVLARTGRGLGGDRTALVELTPEGARLRGSWPGGDEKAGALPDLLANFRRWHAMLEQGTPVAVGTAELASDEQNLVRRHGVQALAVAPVFLGGRWWGGLIVTAETPRLWTHVERKALLAVAGAISAALLVRRGEDSLRDSKRRVERSMEATIYALVATIEMRDPYTAGHQRRVARLAAAIAMRLGLPPDQVRGVYTAGVMHDIGKVYVPSEILTRPGRLTPEEFSLIKCHSKVGYDIASQVDFPWPVADMIRQHHEKLDGSGYPDGLSGDGILVESRILCVADVVEAMASHRPYRPSLGTETALEEIQRNGGRLYDADVVAACTRVLTKDGYEL